MGRSLFCFVFFLANGAGSVGAHIQQPTVSTIVTYLLAIIVAALCMAAIGAGLFFGGKALVNCYTEHCWDEISPLVALVSLAVLVLGAEFAGSDPEEIAAANDGSTNAD